MRVQDVTSASIGFMALPISRAAAIRTAAKENEGLFARNVPSGTAVLCISPNAKQCGLLVTYTNGEKLEQVEADSGGFTGCAFDLTCKPTNGYEFWVKISLTGSKGLSIGYNPTGRKCTLGAATSTLTNPISLDMQVYLRLSGHRHVPEHYD